MAVHLKARATTATTVNGVNINDNYVSSISYEPSSEALGTGTLQVANFSSSVGHDISALTMQTKGGSNQFHGEGFEFLENDDLNAFNPYSKANQFITNGKPQRSSRPCAGTNSAVTLAVRYSFPNSCLD